MSDSSGNHGDTSGAESRGPTEIPEESPASESETALSEQVKARENEGEQDNG